MDKLGMVGRNATFKRFLKNSNDANWMLYAS
jgi:hypothetical protein